MSIILEQIIRQTLLEKSIRSVLKNASDKQFAKAKAAGAVFAYAVKVMGTSDPAQIILEVAASSLTSTNPSGDLTVAGVGIGSKYATKKYIYVMSQPLSKNRQLVNIWIMPYPEAFNKLTGIEAGGKDKGVVRQTGVAVTKQSPNKIGDAELIPVKQYNSRAIQTGVKQLQIESESDLETSKGRKLVDYPYAWESGIGSVEVFTVPKELNKDQEDPFVYIQNNLKKWLQYPKDRFERFLNGEDDDPNFTRVEDEAKIKLLNDLKNPPTPEDPEVVKWDKENKELQDKLSKAQQKYDDKLDELNAIKNKAAIFGTANEIQAAEDELKKFKADPKPLQDIEDAKTNLANHQANKPGAAAELAKKEAEKIELEKQKAIEKQAELDRTTKAEKEDKYTDAEIIAATKSAKYSDVTKWFQQLMLDKINTQPDLVTYLKKKNVYTSFTADGKWGTSSINLTKVLQKALTMDKTGKIDFKLIEQIKKLEQWKKEQNESKISLKTSLNEQGTFDFDDEEETVDLTPKPEKEKPKPEITPKPKSDSKFEVGKKYKLELKSTRLYYFMNNKFVESDYKWVAPNSSYIKYVTTSKQNKNWILVEVDGKKFWVPMDKISKITAVH
jgi:hypothetical protein